MIFFRVDVKIKNKIEEKREMRTSNIYSLCIFYHHSIYKNVYENNQDLYYLMYVVFHLIVSKAHSGYILISS